MGTQQTNLFHETLADALKDVIGAIGGPKAVALALKPDLPERSRHNWLLDCLNPDRDARFTPDQVLWLLREGRKANCHLAMQFIAAQCGYAEPVPLDPRVQEDRIAEELHALGTGLKSALEKLERLEAQRAGVPNFLRVK